MCYNWAGPGGKEWLWVEELTARQREILSYIRKEVLTKGYPPSVREIGRAVGLSSSSTVHGHLGKLEEKGYIRRDPTKPRAIELIHDRDRLRKEIINVPIVGRVTAGEPILAVENIEDFFPMPKDFASYEEEVFMLRVRGESMIGAGIFDGGFVVVRQQSHAENGDIVVALIEDEATVKRLYKEEDHIRLQPENPNMEPIRTKDVRILGKVIGLFRKVRRQYAAGASRRHRLEGRRLLVFGAQLSALDPRLDRPVASVELQLGLDPVKALPAHKGLAHVIVWARLIVVALDVARLSEACADHFAAPRALDLDDDGIACVVDPWLFSRPPGLALAEQHLAYPLPHFASHSTPLLSPSGEPDPCRKKALCLQKLGDAKGLAPLPR